MNFSNGEYIPGSQAHAMKGLWPRPYEGLTKGTILYRFVDTRFAPPQTGADGPWWFEFEHFQTIKMFADRNAQYFAVRNKETGGFFHMSPLSYSARLYAAILYEWSKVIAFVRAELTCSLFAWKGKGKQVQPDKNDARDIATPHGFVTERSPTSTRKMTPMQGPNEVYQLYIPGLGKPHHQFKNYFRFVDLTPI